MKNLTTQRVVPLRILYTMFRVADLDRWVAFYQQVLGRQELRRETTAFVEDPDGYRIELIQSQKWGNH